MKNVKEHEIQMLHREQEAHIELLLDKFKQHLQSMQENYEKSKRYGDSLKMKNEEKLTSQENDQNEEIAKIKEEQVEKITKLEKVISELKSNLVTLKWQTVQYENEEQQFKKAAFNQNEHLKNLDKREKEQKDKIAAIENEKKEVQKNLKKKETEIFKHKFKIKDLQKTKQVLTHLTQDVKASLEPREKQIEDLKENLIDYERTFNKQSIEIKRQQENAKNREKQITELQELIKKERLSTKKQEKKIADFISKINTIVQEKDDNKQIASLMAIYQANLKEYSEELLDKKKKDPETIIELDKQLKYMEKSIDQLKHSTTRNFTKSKENIKKRTNENTELIGQLTKLREEADDRRKRQEVLDKEINEVNIARNRLEQEIE